MTESFPTKLECLKFKITRNSNLFLLLNLWPIFNTHSLHSCKITLFCWQGFSVEGQENIQEILSKQLYLCQFLCAISILRQGKESLFLIHWTWPVNFSESGLYVLQWNSSNFVIPSLTLRRPLCLQVVWRVHCVQCWSCVPNVPSIWWGICLQTCNQQTSKLWEVCVQIGNEQFLLSQSLMLCQHYIFLNFLCSCRCST